MIAKKRPRNVIMPSDCIDRRKEPTYRAGKCITMKVGDLAYRFAYLSNIPVARLEVK